MTHSTASRSLRHAVAALPLVALALTSCSQRSRSQNASVDASAAIAPGATGTPGTPGAVNPAPGAAPGIPLAVGVRLDQLSQYAATLIRTFGGAHPEIAQGISQVEQTAHLPPGSVQNGTWPAAFGIDASRPVVVEVLPVDPGVLAAVDQVAVNRANAGAMVQNWPSVVYTAHCVIPAANAQLLENTLTSLVAGAGQTGAALPGYDSVMQMPASGSSPAVVAAFAHDATSVTLDFAVTGSSAGSPAPNNALDRARAALGTLRTTQAALLAAPPELPAGAISARWNYATLADYNVALGLERVRDAVARLAATDPHRADVSNTGVDEALTSRTLIQRDGAPFAWGSFAIETAPSVRVTFTAHGSPGMNPMPATQGTAYVTDALSSMAGDVSAAFLRAWNLPGDTATHRLTTREFRQQVTLAGGLGPFLASAHLPAALLRAAGEQDPMQALIAAHADAFERIGVDVETVDPDRTASLGILPATATPQTAACALANSPADCAAVALRTGAATNVPNGAAQLVASNNRLAVVASNTPQALARPSLAITSGAVPTARVQFDVSHSLPPARAASVPPAFQLWTATMDATGRDVTVVLTQSPGAR